MADAGAEQAPVGGADDAAAAPALQALQDVSSIGPPQQGRGAKGQYVYWITQAHPKPETVERLGLKTPSDFTREEFNAMVVQVHTASGVTLEETATFREPHENGLPHNSCLVRSLAQYKWKKVAGVFRQSHKAHVDFATHIKTWAEGVVYGCVASDHKQPEALDQGPLQWRRDGGNPLPLSECLPKRWQKEGFVRHAKLTSLAFGDLCRGHNVKTNADMRATAALLAKGGDRAMLAYLHDNDGEAMFAKVLKAQQAQEKARRAGLTREQLLEECFVGGKCGRDREGLRYDMMKKLLQKNGFDGPLQAAVLGAPRTGRAKQRAICLVGAGDSGKSSLFRGLTLVHDTYKRPDRGEFAFLSDFEYNTAAEAWMDWSYFKDFLEGETVNVGRPKNRGGDVMREGTAPILITAPDKIRLMRDGREDKYETDQMDRRIRYCFCTYTVPTEERQEALKHCAHCTARLYLEGGQTLDAPAAEPAEPPPAGAAPGGSRPGPEGGQSAPKRARTAAECVAELVAMKGLLDNGLLSADEFQHLEHNLLNGN
ncbi:unnamed protein product [Prorocentrum cordatum]|uniref:Uncharacterized protein n=1 Tax=Prorocentrum cordatum TaxID=2364126 RepID=A0ABN9XXL3_9DINO|nr:unnamed protein product [Polarella glacialis]